MSLPSVTNDDVDMSLYSRQILTLGLDTMISMSKARILIIGMNGLGLEIAKCVVLAGVKSVTLSDDLNRLISYDDLSSGYYYSDQDIGKERLSTVAPKLAELNPYVQLDTKRHDELTDNMYLNYNLIVTTIGDILSLRKIGDLCHDNNIKFIVATTHGLFGSIFCDFGKHIIVDSNGEQPISGMMTLVTAGCIETDKVHGLSEGTTVKITTKESSFIDTIAKVPTRNSFVLTTHIMADGALADTEFLEIKTPYEMNFLRLSESIEKPEFVLANMCDFNRSPTLHTFNLALADYMTKHSRKPRVWNTEDATEFIDICKTYHKGDYDLNTDVLTKLCYTCDGDLCAMNSVLGGITAQEVIKSVSGKYGPINQWFYMDALSLIPDAVLTQDECIIADDIDKRYSAQVRIFGNTIQRKLAESKVFIVGSGAIGCEHLKNFAMMGFGNIVITDMDNIERSNLNRQFLFRNSDIGKPKSETAAKATRLMNPLINVEPLLLRVGAETLSHFDEKFFSSLLAVTNALDNVQARLFMDQLCVNNGVPLLESGTLGTKGNIQSVIPHMTESYGSTQDPPEQSVPVCTIKNFPYEIDHTIQWARDTFEGTFNRIPNNYLKLLRDPDSVHRMNPTELVEINDDIDFILNNAPKTFNDCVSLSYKQWHENYRNQIHSLVMKFPEDHKLNDMPFWSGTKRFPKVLTFNSTDTNHVDYVFAMSNLWADVFGLARSSRDTVQNMLLDLTPPVLPDDNFNASAISANEAEEKELREQRIRNADPEFIRAKLLDQTIKMKDLSISVTALDFEKDDDTNFHIDFITATSNMRALNYGITPVDRFKTKGIAGKIVPAIATTTAVVSGLVSMELVKVLYNYDKIDRYNNAYVNLAIPFFGFTEPGPVERTKIGKLDINIWKSFTFDNPTVKDLVTYFEQYDVNLLSVLYGTNQLYASFQPPRKRAERLNSTVADIIKTINPDTVLTNPFHINIIIEEETDNDDPVSECINCRITF